MPASILALNRAVPQVINLAGGGGGANADKLRPVGTIYQSVVNTDPGLLFGGVWARYGKGKVAVGLNTGDADFNAVGKTGGAKTHALTAAQMPVHNHVLTISAATLPSAGAHTHTVRLLTNGSLDNKVKFQTGGAERAGYVSTEGAHTHAVTPSGTIGNTGGGGAHNNLMPFLTVYAWKRVA